MKIALYTLSMLATLCSMLGCQSVRELGSACPDGVCVQAAPNTDPTVPCLVNSVVAEIAFNGATDVTVCLPRPLTVDDAGQVDCTLGLSMVTDDEMWCSSLGLERTEEGSGLSGEMACAVPQVPAQSDARGWYYDDFSDAVELGCTAEDKQRIALTETLTLPDGATVMLRCTQVLASAEDAAPGLELPAATVELEISSCLAPATGDVSGVGDACLPRATPADGFDDREAYVQTGASDCETGTCMVYHLGGDPSDSCVPSGDETCISTPTEPCPPVVRCATEADVDARVYCTCRCDDGEGGGCDCPDGFSCVDAVDHVSDRFDGGYCVRNSSVTG